MNVERDRTRNIVVVTFTPEEFRHFQSATLPDGVASRKTMERIRQCQMQWQRDGIGAPIEIRVMKPEPPLP